MRRGDIVKVALPGDLGKPRPALVIQSNDFLDTGSVVVLPMSSQVEGISLFRVQVEPSQSNGLYSPSQIMTDKITNLRREKVGGIIGRLEADTLAQIDQQLAVFLGLA
jgi:mRNA interferase MazF